MLETPTRSGWIFDEEGFRKLGITVDAHGKMPDVVIHFKKKDWLVLVEAVTSHGPIDPKRQAELKILFAPCKDRLVFVTAFLTQRDLTKFSRSDFLGNRGLGCGVAGSSNPF
jgi:hypothetical protein